MEWRRQESILIIATAVLLLGMLGGRELWTAEHRWAEIVIRMFYYHDFVHPVLNHQNYYDKPLLSYWLIALFAKLFGNINVWTLRLPSALAGILAIVSVYRIGCITQNKNLGNLAAWMLLTTYYFIFWARVSTADMLNLGGTLFAVAWYFEKRNQPNVRHLMVFFIILAVTALCKGLIGPAVAFLVVSTDVCIHKTFRQYLDWKYVWCVIPAILIYFLPFYLSMHFQTPDYQSVGIFEVYRENILRYFKPFDHKESFYVYFFYLPFYLLPWTFFFVPSIFSVISHWKKLEKNTKYYAIVVLLLFLFFTLSGSRRSYYILPVVPFAILMTGNWILLSERRIFYAKKLIDISFLLFFFIFVVFLPMYYSKGGANTFEKTLQAKLKVPLSSWKFTLLDAEYKMHFYLHLPPTVKNWDAKRPREHQTKILMESAWPILLEQPQDTIIISRKLHGTLLHQILPHYQMVEAEPTYLEIIFKIVDPNSPIAFIPKER